MDTTEFTTEQMAFVILRELIRPIQFRCEEGEFFSIKLKVPVHRADAVGERPLTIRVRRLDLSGDTFSPTHVKKNNDSIIATTAHLPSEEGKPFDIEVTIPYRRSKTRGALITVSEEMERIILQRFHDDIERELS